MCQLYLQWRMNFTSIYSFLFLSRDFSFRIALHNSYQSKLICFFVLPLLPFLPSMATQVNFDLSPLSWTPEATFLAHLFWHFTSEFFNSMSLLLFFKYFFYSFEFTMEDEHFISFPLPFLYYS